MNDNTPSNPLQGAGGIIFTASTLDHVRALTLVPSVASIGYSAGFPLLTKLQVS